MGVDGDVETRKGAVRWGREGGAWGDERKRGEGGS